MNDPIVIASAARTPIGGLLGDFAGLKAWQLGAVALRAAIERAGVKGDAVWGLGARGLELGSGWPSGS